ncbi:MAG: hypothetical protein AVDCRST_MAG80-396, partial [uncultured Rubrobacteraceae bacterium]
DRESKRELAAVQGERAGPSFPGPLPSASGKQARQVRSPDAPEHLGRDPGRGRRPFRRARTGPRLGHYLPGAWPNRRRVPTYCPLYGPGRGEAKGVGAMGHGRLDELFYHSEGLGQPGDPVLHRRAGIRSILPVLRRLELTHDGAM